MTMKIIMNGIKQLQWRAELAKSAPCRREKQFVVRQLKRA
jgi:hypothetical protein